MANSSSDARHSESDIRRRLIEDRLVDVMVAVSPNFFYTVTLPVTLWFLDRGKRGTERPGRVLFIDARQVFRQVDRAHRDFTDDRSSSWRTSCGSIAARNRSWRTERTSSSRNFPDGTYTDVTGLCKVATVEEIEAQGWSLSPGRYAGAEVQELDVANAVRRGSKDRRPAWIHRQLSRARPAQPGPSDFDVAPARRCRGVARAALRA